MPPAPPRPSRPPPVPNADAARLPELPSKLGMVAYYAIQGSYKVDVLVFPSRGQYTLTKNYPFLIGLNSTRLTLALIDIGGAQ